MFLVFCVSNAFASVHCCILVTCWERAGLLALVDVVYCIFVTFPCGILAQVRYLIESFPDLCRLFYQDKSHMRQQMHDFFYNTLHHLCMYIQRV